MTLPGGIDSGLPPRRGVTARRDTLGRWQFRDLETGVRITNYEGVKRLSFDPESNQVIDSLGNRVGVGALGMIRGGVFREFKNGFREWEKLSVSPQEYQIKPNQSFVERLTVRNYQGEIQVIEITHGKGEEFKIKSRSPQAKRWGGALREAMGLDVGASVTSAELEQFIVHSEVVVVTSTYK